MRQCHECQHHTSARTGPHEWRAGCDLQVSYFLDAEHCNFYLPDVELDEEEQWPTSATIAEAAA